MRPKKASALGGSMMSETAKERKAGRSAPMKSRAAALIRA